MISELRLQQFRCFAELKLNLPRRGALFIGDNAQGKTSILEAVCMLVRLQSPRVKRTRTMIMLDATEFGIAGECWESERRVRYGRAGLSMQVEGEEVAKQGEYFRDGGLIVWMGNNDLELIRGPGEVRRRYLDFAACQMDFGYRQSLARYRRALKVRNLLLKSSKPREAEISAYDQVLIETGDYVSGVRHELAKTLQPLVNRGQEFVGRGRELVGIEYSAGSGGDMKSALAMTYDRDRARGLTSAGPHRDEIKLMLNGLSAAEYASEGQQRTLALALKLGQGEFLKNSTSKLPVYLLDDIFGELDHGRRNAIMDFLPTDAQILITTTNLDWLDEKWDQWKRFLVADGKVF